MNVAGNEGMESGEKKVIIFPSHMLIAEYLNKVKSCEREQLKVGLKALCEKMFENNIVVPLDFEPYGEIFYSDIFDRDIMFLSSAGVLCEKPGSIIYEITEKGEKLLENRDANYKNVSLIALKTLDGLLADLNCRQSSDR